MTRSETAMKRLLLILACLAAPAWTLRPSGTAQPSALAVVAISSGPAVKNIQRK